MSQYSTGAGKELSVADDVLTGAAEIGRFRGNKTWQIYRLFALGRLQGVWKDGAGLKGSKSAISRDHHNKARGGK